MPAEKILEIIILALLMAIVTQVRSGAQEFILLFALSLCFVRVARPAILNPVLPKRLKKQLPPKVSRKDRVPSEGVPIPTQGWPKWHYRLNKHVRRRPDLVPKLNAAQHLAYTKDLLKERMLELGRLGIHPTIWVGNFKGGAGKTFITLVGASIMRWVLQLTIYVLPTSTNTKTGTVAKLAGLEGKTLTVRQYYARLAEFASPNFRKLGRAVAATDVGLFVIGEDSGNRRARKDSEDSEPQTFRGRFLAPMFNAIFNNVREATHILWTDTGNDDVEEMEDEDEKDQSIVVQALRKAGVAVFACNLGVSETADKLGDTILDHFQIAEDEGPGIPRKERKNESGIPLIDKIRYSVVAIIGVEKGQEDPELYRHLVDLGTDKHGEPIFQGKIVLIHKDEYLFTVKKNLDIFKISDLATWDFCNLDCTILEQAAWLLGIDVPQRHPAIRISTSTNTDSTPALAGTSV
jgi:hypothetical protein